MLESLLIKLQTLQPGALFQPHPKRAFFQTAFLMEHLQRLLLSV